MRVEIHTCDRCGDECTRVTVLTSKAIGLRRELCADCVDSLRAFLGGRPDPHFQTVTQFETRELEHVYRRGAEALEAWAMGATADQLAEAIRDMLSRARRETVTTNGTLLGISVRA